MMLRDCLFLMVLAALVLPVGLVNHTGGDEEAGPSAFHEQIFAGSPTGGHFTENLGQWEMDLELVASVGFGHVGLSREGFLFHFPGPEGGGGCILTYDLMGGSRAVPSGRESLGQVNNYFYGSDPSGWVSGARSFKGANYKEAWDGIDINFNIGEEGVKYEFVVAPFANPEDISLEIAGHRAVNARSDDLVIELEDGRYFAETELKAFYLDDPDRSIEVEFTFTEPDRIGYILGDYDRSRAIVIDPLLLNSTYIGIEAGEGCTKIISGPDGCIYGIGDSGGFGFPTTPGAYDDTWDGYYDVIAFKMDADLTELVYATYIGGRDGDFATDIKYAESGEVVICGYTNSGDFPATNGSYQADFNRSGTGFYDLFLLRLNRTGGNLRYSTYIGWGGEEKNPRLGLGPDGTPVLLSSISNSSIPVNGSSYDSTFNGGILDLLLIKMNNDSSRLEYITFIGGSGDDIMMDMEMTSDYVLYFTGYTYSRDFPVTATALEPSYNSSGRINGFAASFDMVSNSILNSTYINHFQPQALVMDEERNFVITGVTNSTSIGTTPGAYQPRNGGYYDCMVMRIDRNCSRLLASTFFGGYSNETVFDVGINETGCVFITGIGGLDFPTTRGAYSETSAGGIDVFVSTFSSNLTQLIYSTFIGGSRWDYSSSILVEGGEKAYVAGESSSNNYPTTIGSYQQVFGGVTDISISRMKCPKVFLPPTKPRNLTGFMVNGSVVLEWDEPKWDGDTPVIGYNITRCEEEGEAEIVGTTSETNFLDTSIENGTTYLYFVTAYNRIEDSAPSRSIEIWETDPPEMCADLTPSVHPPGMDLLFSVNITDNSRIDQVKVMHWIDGNSLNEDIMYRKTGDNFVFEVQIDDAEMDIHYRFLAVDIKGNSLLTDLSTVRVRGDFLPVFVTDMTPGEVDTLGSVLFSVEVSDNWSPPKVWVEYRTGEGPIRISEMERTDQTVYSLEVGVTGYPGDMIEYTFGAEDIHGNRNKTTSKNIKIVDRSPPVFKMDLSSLIATTGDPFIFRASPYDEIRITSMKVSYWIDDGHVETEELSEGIGGIYAKEVVLPHRTGVLRYQFTAMDLSGNENSSEVFSLPMIDNDHPEISEIALDDTADNGGVLTASALATDNIGIDEIRFVYWFGAGERFEIASTGEGLFKVTVDVPFDEPEPLFCMFHAEDTSGNLLSTPQMSVPLVDRIPPSVQQMDDMIVYSNELVRIEPAVDDNIGIMSILWTGLTADHEGRRWEGNFEGPKTLNITVTAVDISGNEGSMSFTVRILDDDHDSDGDGLPDSFEVENGLSPDDSTDAYLDMDSDGLSNLEEYLLGTDIGREDSDSDGMPDGWEVQYGLDPLYFSAFNDADGDDLTDLEEYLEGTDPKIPNITEEERQRDRTMLYASIAAAIVLVLISVFLILFGKRRSK
ncbi:MAG: fibronectin type III domain-containing protein [Thermoplasmatota archaeon]